MAATDVNNLSRILIKGPFKPASIPVPPAQNANGQNQAPVELYGGGITAGLIIIQVASSSPSSIVLCDQSQQGLPGWQNGIQLGIGGVLTLENFEGTVYALSDPAVGQNADVRVVILQGVVQKGQ